MNLEVNYILHARSVYLYLRYQCSGGRAVPHWDEWRTHLFHL